MRPTRSRFAVSLAAILLLSIPAAGSDPDPAAIFDGPRVRPLLGILEGSTFLEDWELRAAALKSLDRTVSEAGAPLVDECIARIRAGKAEEIRRAQILLALTSDLPPAKIAGLAEHPKIEVSAWARLLGGEATRIETLDGPGLYRVGSPPGRDPLLDVGDSIRERLVLTDEELQKRKPEFVKDYETVLLPRLENLADAIPEKERRVVDLDGDGVDELVVASDSLLDDWIHDYRFLAVIRRERPDAPWRLHSFLRLEDSEVVREVIVARLDPRGPPCVLVTTELLAVTHSWPQLRVLRGDGEPLLLTTGSYGRGFEVLPAHAGRPPLLVTRDVHQLSSTGTALELMGALCFSVHLHELGAEGFLSIGHVFLPLDLD